MRLDHLRNFKNSITLQRKKKKRSDRMHLYIGGQEWRRGRRIEDTGDNRYNQAGIDKCVCKGQNEVLLSFLWEGQVF